MFIIIIPSLSGSRAIQNFCETVMQNLMPPIWRGESPISYYRTIKSSITSPLAHPLFLSKIRVAEAEQRALGIPELKITHWLALATTCAISWSAFRHSGTVHRSEAHSRVDTPSKHGKENQDPRNAGSGSPQYKKAAARDAYLSANSWQRTTITEIRLTVPCCNTAGWRWGDPAPQKGGAHVKSKSSKRGPGAMARIAAQQGACAGDNGIDTV
ncbi:hypothetical protein GGX14DRAFT_407271 [Mycena pura]|uniref:Uncharacterized protein n=1 Tax=Mycena pura TaxID=153505 RepID=A0AAD6URK3_9AGAR|nr:hypothetical protein GGX14DRAFT_407271 [Mycena pura]